MVGYDPGWRESIFLQKLDHQFRGGIGIATALDQEIEHLALDLTWLF